MSSHALRGLLIVLVATAACGDGAVTPVETSPSLDAQVRQALNGWGVVPILPPSAPDPALVDLGRSLFFDKILSGNRDVSCSSCHKPSTGTGDGLSLAIGTGALRTGATPTLGEGRQLTPRNAAPLFGASLRPFYLFWDGRVSDFGGQSNFATPAGAALPTGLASVLAAQAMIPVTNRVEMRGIPGDHDVFGNANELAVLADSQYAAIWSALMRRVLAVNAYVQKFNAAYPSVPVGQLGFQHAANAIAAFEVASFARTNSAFDRYLARDDNALSVDAKRGALLFFGKARCVECHAVSGQANEMFSDFKEHVIGVPQIAPAVGNAPFDGPGADEDFGLEQVTGLAEDRYKFRTSPMRNAALQPAFFHNGCFTRLEDAIRHHLDVFSSARNYDPLNAGVAADLIVFRGPIDPVLERLDPLLASPIGLGDQEFRSLIEFVRDGLLDKRAQPEHFRSLVPEQVPSGHTPLVFEFEKKLP
jgi:cytochrome c peroxidase